VDLFQVGTRRIGTGNYILPACLVLGDKLAFRVSQDCFRGAQFHRNAGFLSGACIEVGFGPGSRATARDQFIMECLLGGLSVACPG
jgi:hypothetical protein